MPLLHVLASRISKSQIRQFGILKFITIIAQGDDDVIAYLLAGMQTNFDALLMLLHLMAQIKRCGVRQFSDSLCASF